MDETFTVAVGEPQEGWSELSTPYALENFMRYFLLPAARGPRRAVDPLLRVRPRRPTRARSPSGRATKGSRS